MWPFSRLRNRPSWGWIAELFILAFVIWVLISVLPEAIRQLRDAPLPHQNERPVR